MPGQNTLFVTGLEHQPRRHHLRESHLEDCVAPVVGLQVVDHRVTATVEMVGTGHVTGIVIGQQVPARLVTVDGHGGFARRRVNGVHLHRSDKRGLVHLLSSVGIGVEMLEIPGTGRCRNCERSYKCQACFSSVQYVFHGFNRIRIGVLR